MIRVALKNVLFDSDYENVLRFDSESERNTFFDIPKCFEKSLNYNFQIGEFYLTKKRIAVSDVTVQELMNYNYAIFDDNGKYYFYFIVKSKYLGYSSIECDLELDVFQTYYLSTTFSSCNIRRACLPRFDEISSTKVRFKTNIDSPFFERDEIQNVAKRMISRTVLSTEPSNEPSVNAWFRDNLLGWNVYFLQSRSEGQDGYTFFDLADLSKTAKYRLSISSDYGILPIALEPVYKDSSRNSIWLGYGSTDTLSIDTPHEVLTAGAFEGFRAQNNNSSFVYSAKFVPYTPFTFSDINAEATLISDGAKTHLLIYSTSFSGYYAGVPSLQGYATSDQKYSSLESEKGQGIVVLGSIPSELKCSSYTANYQLEFLKSDIIGSEKSPKFNPKLLTADFHTIRLTNERGDGYEYDPLKIGQRLLRSKLSDPLTPDTTRTYFRLTNLSGVYISECDSNLTGFVDSADTSLMVDNDNLSAMLAQNKNFFLQSTFKVLESGFGALVGGKLAGVGGALSGGGGIASSLINQYLSIDNMRNAPNDVKNANGSIYFNRQYSECGPIIEEYDILENEKEIINDFMHRNGFSYNRIGNIKDFDHFRKYFDFVVADVELIQNSNGISAQIRNKFKEIFSRGLRFWHDATKIGDFLQENYERSLENGTQI